MQAGEHELWVSANFMPIRDESGQVESVLCIARDITNEKTWNASSSIQKNWHPWEPWQPVWPMKLTTLWA